MKVYELAEKDFVKALELLSNGITHERKSSLEKDLYNAKTMKDATSGTCLYTIIGKIYF